MSLHEIDELLRDTAALWREPSAAAPLRSLVLGNLDTLPERLELDASGPGTGVAAERELHVYELGVLVMEHASAVGRRDLARDWCAFLLNFWSHMPDTPSYAPAQITAQFFPRMRAAIDLSTLADHRPRHPTLTLYPDGSKWFEPAHDALVRALFSPA